MTLAYVFWHWPAQRARYEERLQAFHAALRRPGSVTFRLDRAPFDDAEPPYEDWYPVRDWADVGALNDEAVQGATREPHDAVAAMSRKGAGAVYRRLDGDLPLRDVTFAAWSTTPPAGVPPGAVLWQRQLVLGPAPEYALLAASSVDAPPDAVLTRSRVVASGA